MKVKSIWLWILLVITTISSCKYDDSELWDKVNSLDDRVTNIEEQLTQMNTNISSISTIVNAMNDNLFITNLKETTNGYSIQFSNGETATLINGTDGKDAPVIGIDEFEGKYYWIQIIDDKKSWLTDKDGNKLPVTGADAITPILKIDSDGYWLVSYDRGITFTNLLDENSNPVKAVGKDGTDGEDGKDGADGDSFFSSVKVEDDVLILVLVDGTELRIPLETDANSIAPVEVCMDVNNPLFAHITTDENDLIYLYTDKDENGYPTKLTEMVVEMNDGNISDIIFDDGGKPTMMIAPNGVKFLLEWTSDTYAVLTAIDPTTGDQLNTYIDLEEDENLESKAVSRSLIARTGNLKMEILPYLSSVQSHVETSSRSAEITSATIPVKMFLKNCGSLQDATCYIDVIGTDDRFLTRIKGHRVSQGIYEAYVPKSFFSDYEDDYNNYDQCVAFIDFMSNICLYNNVRDKVLNKLDNIFPKVESKAIPVALALAGHLAKEGLKRAVLAYCKYIDDIASNELIDPCQLIKKAAIYNSSHVTLYPKVYAIPYDIYGQPVTVDLGTGAIADLEITWGGEPTISSFTLNPSAPMAGVFYVATAELYCIPVGSVVEMSIIGTDGYTDSASLIVEEESKNFTVNLYVPGAETGVYDECKVIVTTPDGETKSKTASLIFQ